MKDETRIWLNYAEDNLKSSRILSENHLFNPCLHNIQQAVEKSLKAILVEKVLKLKRTHDIYELKNLLLDNDIKVDISDEDCDFINAIYMPSKYPVTSVFPEFDPDINVCINGINIAEKILKSVKQNLQNTI